MISEDSQEDQVYDLDLDADNESDAERAIREAIDAVEARSGDDDDPPASKPEAPSDQPFAAASEGVSSQEVARLEADLAESKERALRALADLENYRRRSEKRAAEEKRYAGEAVLRECLEVLDNLQRAVSADADSADLKAGVEMIVKQFSGMLERAGVRAVEAVGERFDPAVHEAVARTEDEVEAPTVVEQYQQGYLLHDRLLRASMVRVAVPTSTSSGETGAGE